MQTITKFDAKHEDLIHAVEFDFYGKKLATCSSDHRIKIWEKDGNWLLTADWKAHDGSVLTISWAHPEYGLILASGGFDRSVKIWEASGKRWSEKAKLTESKDVITSLAFSPPQLGLKLAVVGDLIRIYECLDAVQLGSWTLMWEIVMPGQQGCVAWSSQGQLAIGRGNLVKIFQLKDQKWSSVLELSHPSQVLTVAWAPNLGRGVEWIATSCKDDVRLWKWQGEGQVKPIVLETSAWKVEWNVTGTVLATTGDDGKMRMWKQTFLDEWKLLTTVDSQ